MVTDFSKYSYDGWTCTEAYNNTIYAKYACPFNTALCGTTDYYAMSEGFTTKNISMQLTRGDVCFYKVATSCGVLKTDLV